MACVHTAPAALQQTEFYQKNKIKILWVCAFNVAKFQNIHDDAAAVSATCLRGTDDSNMRECAEKVFFRVFVPKSGLCCVIRVLGVDCG